MFYPQLNDSCIIVTMVYPQLNVSYVSVTMVYPILNDSCVSVTMVYYQLLLQISISDCSGGAESLPSPSWGEGEHAWGGADINNQPPRRHYGLGSPGTLGGLEEEVHKPRRRCTQNRICTKVQLRNHCNQSRRLLWFEGAQLCKRNFISIDDHSLKK